MTDILHQLVHDVEMSVRRTLAERLAMLPSAPRDLIRRIPGVTLRDLPDKALCCGSAGVYNITHAAMARSLGDRKAKAVGETGASMLVTASPGCHLQMQASLARAGSDVRVMHLVDLIDLALTPESSR